MISAPLRFRHLSWVLAGVAAIYVLYTVWVVAVRVPYPYDHLMWAESPFLTNMLKLHNGVELYGPAADANSFVYSPGLEYICWALLSPFDLHLDVRACRLVNVAIGVAAVAAASHYVLGSIEAPKRRTMLVFATCAVGLVLTKNLSFDICHPDNLHALQIAGGLVLGRRALERRSFRWSLIAAALVGCGILFKQTGALGGIGLALFLALAGRKEWGDGKAALVVVAALVTTALGGWWLLVHHTHGRFWLFDVLTAHTVSLAKLDHLFAFEAGNLHRSVLYLGGMFIVVKQLMGDDAQRREHTWLWLFVGFFGVLPTLAAYTKRFGAFNNLVVIDLWAAMLVVPFLIHHARDRVDASAALLMFTLGLYPTKQRPLPDHHRYGKELEDALVADREHKVLVAHGTAAWIRAGLRRVPLDRSNSVLELEAAGMADRAGTTARIREGYYDRIYIAWPRFPLDVHVILAKHYEPERTIAAVPLDDFSPQAGWSREMVAPIVIFKRK